MRRRSVCGNGKRVCFEEEQKQGCDRREREEMRGLVRRLRLQWLAKDGGKCARPGRLAKACNEMCARQIMAREGFAMREGSTMAPYLRAIILILRAEENVLAPARRAIALREERRAIFLREERSRFAIEQRALRNVGARREKNFAGGRLGRVNSGTGALSGACPGAQWGCPANLENRST